MLTLAQELQRLHALKETALEKGRDKSSADADFKMHQAHCLDRMEAEEAESFRTGGMLYSAINDRIKGQIEDRRLYIRWALENDEGIQEFLNVLTEASTGGLTLDEADALVNDFYDAIMGTSMVHYKEDGTVVNSQAKAHIDDELPLPPGLTFRPDPYIAQRAS